MGQLAERNVNAVNKKAEEQCKRLTKRYLLLANNVTICIK